MFVYENGIFISTFLKEKNVPHGFSTRKGGVSVLSHTSSMNLGFGRGDEDSVVLENLNIFSALSGIESASVAFASQIHSTKILKIENEDFTSPTEECDGFITNQKGVSLLVRVADCVPVLFYGNGVVCAVHAGWRGTVSGICKNAVESFSQYGVNPKDITVAIGHCIHSCCFEVKEDFYDAVIKEAGVSFAKRHVKTVEDKMFADIVGMNVEILKSCGVSDIDISPYCTACEPSLFHSHRKTNGKRGTMGAIISLGL